MWLQIILSQGIGVGIGAGMLYVPCVAIVGHYFKRRRTLAMAIVTSGSSIGGVIHPIMLNRLLRSDLGFANSVRASAGLVSGVLLLAACLMRTNAPKTASTPFLPAMRKFSRDWVYLFVTLGGFLFSVGFYFPIFYIQLDANKHHVDSSFAFYSIVVLNASSSVGRILPGFIARYIGIINMLCMCCIGCSAVVFGMIGLQSLASVAVIGVIYGLFSGAYIGLLAPMVSLLSDSPSELGIRMGFAFTMQGLGGLIGTPLVGAVLTREYIWSHGAVCAGVFCIGGTASYMMARVLMEFRKAHRDDKRTGHAVE